LEKSPQPPLKKGEAVKKFFPHPTLIVVREPGDDERGQHRREKDPKRRFNLVSAKGDGALLPVSSMEVKLPHDAKRIAIWLPNRGRPCNVAPSPAI
jgi:hypothetical protein